MTKLLVDIVTCLLPLQRTHADPDAAASGGSCERWWSAVRRDGA